ncbi:MAG TPA: CPBP family intramembrane glutamic endopeptidase [Pyrinomonadaceae bacterium]|nr:CPBP family intramembrane glutamic endopeptidase [Pyrinomonadaceae bacterium]
MDLYSVIFNKFGRLRSGWRLAIYILAFIALWVLLETFVRIIYLAARTLIPSHPYASYFANVAYRFTLLGAGLGAGYFCVRLLENLPWRSLGLTMHQRWVRDLIVGTAIGVAAVAFAVAIATAAGGLQFTFIGNEMLLAAGRSLLTAGVLLFVAALAEEAAFRGYPLQTLTRAGLMWLGVILTSVPFGFAHLWNPNVVPGITFANTVIAGFWLAAAYLKTRSLWFPLGVHWGWNWALGSIFGLPISGVRFFSNPILRGQDVGPAWLTGGNYGIEGGVAGTAALIAFTLLIWRTRLVAPTQELLKLTSEENPATTPRVSIRS